jgi:hypothetical protein
MLHRSSRLGRNIIVLVSLAVLGGQQASAAWICLPPIACVLGWLFTLGGVVQGTQEAIASQSRAALTPTDDSSAAEAPPLCLTEDVSMSVWLEADKAKINPGDSLTVKVYADINEPIVSFGFHLDYDTSLLFLDGLQVAPAFRALDSQYPDGVAALAYPTPAEGDRVLLATANFTGRDVGTADIGIAITAGDATEGFALRGCGEADITVTPTSVKIERPRRPPPPIPEPTTMLSLVVGFGLLSRRALRRA